ncbi:unnamed protein product [Cochlearia groenlandica]
MYNGITYHVQHITTFAIEMGRVQFAPQMRDTSYCQLFAENLERMAQRWLRRLTTNSINNFHRPQTAFLKHYSMFINQEQSTANQKKRPRRAPQSISIYRSISQLCMTLVRLRHALFVLSVIISNGKHANVFPDYRSYGLFYDLQSSH